MSKNYDIKDTIISISSGFNKSAIAIIRMSGDDCFEIASKFIKPTKSFKNIKPDSALKLSVYDENDELIDRVIAIPYIEPKSYTGENMLEIFCHGSTYIVKKIINTAIKYSARQAYNGEFSFRAFLNGKIDLSQAEAINDLINSETKKQHEIAIRQLSGNIKSKINSIKENLIELLSEIEVRIDDNYEEMEKLDYDKFQKKLSNIINECEKFAKSFESGKYLKSGVKIAITGLPNSGKSSLLNTLVGYNRAIVSQKPGTTRDTIEETMEINGYKVIINDTAGINLASEDEIEKEGIERSRDAIKKADIIIFLIDISQKADMENEKIEREIIENKRSDSTLIKVFSKSDLKPKIEIPDNSLKISSLTNENIDRLKEIIISNIESKNFDSGEILTSIRHYKCLNESLVYLNETKKIICSNQKEEIELIAENLRSALNSLVDIVGETTSEDILHKIFSDFCVGK
jgi:tRNA modification GTPase